MMIIDKPYRTNHKTGTILGKEIISVKCDGCGDVRSVRYSKYVECKQQGLCFQCAVEKAAKCRRKKIQVKCTHCKKKLRIIPSKIRKHNYCDINCRDVHLLSRYAHLSNVFENNVNHVAYLFGLILGDGHCKKTQKHTTRISIAFDAHYPELEQIATAVFDHLQIKWYKEPKVHKNCCMIGFVLPDTLLAGYHMLYSGNKFSIQPYPTDNIIANPNFAAGLVNSDGYFTKPKFGRGWLTFSNTVKSIVDAYTNCLNFNNIASVTYSYTPKVDKRNGKMPKRGYQVNIHKQVDIASLRSKCEFKIKE